jgi:hypothetical protein
VLLVMVDSVTGRPASPDICGGSKYPNFIQDIEDRCLLLTSSTSFIDLPFQEHRMTEKHHMDQNPCISSLCPK